MLQSGCHARHQCRLLWSPIPNLNLAGEGIRVSSARENQLLCSNHEIISDEKISQWLPYPFIPPAASFNLATCGQFAGY
jgi:hypothetical protein